MKNIPKIVKGNPFDFCIPLASVSAGGAEPVDAVLLTDIVPVILCNGRETALCSVFANEDYIDIHFPKEAVCGTYDISFTAKYDGAEFRVFVKSACEIVGSNDISNIANYVNRNNYRGDVQFFLACTMTSQELEEVIARYNEAIIEAESAKEAYEEKSSNLTAVAEVVEDIPDLAKQGDDPEATNTAILKAIGDIEIDDMATETAATANKNEILSAIGAIPTPEGMATEANLNAKSADILTAISDAVASILGTDTTATLTAIKSAISGIDFSTLATEANATSNKEAILTAIGQIDFSALAKQGSDATATNTAILSAIRNIVLPPNIAEKSDIADAVTALKGNDTTQTLTALATAIENIPSPVDYATETNATANKTALQGTDPTATLTNILVAIAGAVATLRGTDTNASLTGLTAWEQATDTDINNLFNI